MLLNSNLNDSIQWKLVDSTTGTSQIAIPSDAKEIYVEVTRGTSTEIVYDFCIPIISLTNVEKLFYRQYWTGSNAYHSGVIKVTNKYVFIHRVLSNNNTDIASTSTITLYYR